MSQQQFNVLDALIVARIGIADEKELIIWAAFAYDIATRNALSMSQTLQNLALQVWG